MTGSLALPTRLLAGYAQRHPLEFALAIAGGSKTAVRALLECLPARVAPAVMMHLPPTMAASVLEGTTDDTLVGWLSEANLDSAVRLARRIGQPRRTHIMESLPVRRRELDRYCAFPENCVGAFLDMNFAAVRDTEPIAAAAATLRDLKTADHTPLLVVDDEQRLVGWMDAHQALLLGIGGSVRDCVVPVRPLLANASLATARVEFAVRGEAWLPVVDARSRPLGLLRRTRLPEASRPSGSGTPGPLVALATSMFEVLAELPRLAAPPRRAP